MLLFSLLEKQTNKQTKVMSGLRAQSGSKGYLRTTLEISPFSLYGLFFPKPHDLKIIGPFVFSLQPGCKIILLHSFSNPQGRALEWPQLQCPRGMESCLVRVTFYNPGDSVQVPELRQESMKAVHSSDPSWHLCPVLLMDERHGAMIRISSSITPWLCDLWQGI